MDWMLKHITENNDFKDQVDTKIKKIYSQISDLIKSEKDEKVIDRLSLSIDPDTKTNHAYAVFSYYGEKAEYYSFSNINYKWQCYSLGDIEDIKIVHANKEEEDREFDTLRIDERGKVVEFPFEWDRFVDTEAKILEEIYKIIRLKRIVFGKTDKEFEGELLLYTRKFPCESCCGVLDQFKDFFHNVKITVYYNIKAGLPVQKGVPTR